MFTKRCTNGKSHPPGAQIADGGVNYCIYSASASSMELLLFAKADDDVPESTIVLDPVRNKTYGYWHVFVPGVGHGQVYAWRANGPFAPKRGLRFDGKKVLLDPYGKAVVGWKKYSRASASKDGDNCASALRSVVIDSSQYDWEGDSPPRTPYAQSIIYEMHVGGFTRNSNSGVAAAKRGTFSGVIEKIPYLQELGVTAVELMPVQQYDASDLPAGRSNYWGYSTVGFLAPHNGYCVGGDPIAGITEFKDMVKALHRAGIEVILDVVFNHTSEGGADGPTLCFKGLENSAYYILDNHDPSQYANYSGCGNVFNANHPITGRLILESLRYWVSEMHVDGFRFDLASALTRDVFGEPMAMPPLLWLIECDDVLAGSKLIAEAWDASGLYQVGAFISKSHWYAEWNGPFRDDVRKFVKGDRGSVGTLAARILSSSDIYSSAEREPNRSINFLTCHDGFTLNDLVSYNSKHNEANGEENQDGADANFSWNCGTEGSTDDPHILQLRLRQMKNLLTILFVSQGTPMLLMGDEVARTQGGNNNAYCQDSELSWFNWSAVHRCAEILHFVRQLIVFTKSLALFQLTRPFVDHASDTQPSVIWHGVKLSAPDWSADSHSLAFTMRHPQSGEQLHVILNAYWEPLKFELPALESTQRWVRIVDTTQAPPNDICLKKDFITKDQNSYVAGERSVVVLMVS